MGRQNPGKRHNSLTGQEAVMGLSSGKYWTIQQGQKVVEFVMVQLNCLTKNFLSTSQSFSYSFLFKIPSRHTML